MAYDPYSLSTAIDLGSGDIQLERIPATPNSAGSFRAVHTVLEGETIQNIAFKYYGDSGYWMRICDVNSIYNPLTELTPGMELYIP